MRYWDAGVPRPVLRPVYLHGKTSAPRGGSRRGKSNFPSVFCEFGKFFRAYVVYNRQVIETRLQVLTQGQHTTFAGSKLQQDLFDFFDFLGHCLRAQRGDIETAVSAQYTEIG